MWRKGYAGGGVDGGGESGVEESKIEKEMTGTGDRTGKGDDANGL